MSGEVLYERYKDALKRGHVASLRGSLEVALAAYAEAAEIAPDRSTPHTSAGNALLRGKRPAEALHHYGVALRLASRDEAALLGYAQALAALDRRGEAADAFDAVADVRAEAGRLSEAVEAARRALELAEGRHRRRTLERMIDRLRASEPGEPGRIALELALLVLDGPAMAQAARPSAAEAAPSGHAVDEPEAAPEPPIADDAIDATPDPRPARPARRRPVPVPGATTEAARLDMDADIAIDRGQPGVAVECLLRAAAAHRRAGELDAALDACTRALGIAPRAFSTQFALVRLYRELGWTHLLDEKLSRLGRIVELDGDVDLEGTVPAAVERTVALAAYRRGAGNLDAAMDACYVALSVAPDDVDLHLALADLYADRGWTTLATEKLDLLARLATLDDDASVADRVREARTTQELSPPG